MRAADRGHERVVEMLLQHGAEVNLQSRNGRTALRSTAGNGHERVVDLLIWLYGTASLVRVHGRAGLVDDAVDAQPSNGALGCASVSRALDTRQDARQSRDLYGTMMRAVNAKV